VNSVPLTLMLNSLVEMLFGDGPKGNKFANTGVGETISIRPFTLETVS